MVCGRYCEAVVLVYMLLEERKSTPLIKTAERRDEVRRDGSPAGHSVSLVFGPVPCPATMPADHGISLVVIILLPDRWESYHQQYHRQVKIAIRELLGHILSHSNY